MRPLALRSTPMSTTIERSRLLTHAKSIVESAKSAGRDLNDAEAHEVEADISKIKSLDAKPKGIDYLSQIKAISKVGDGEVNDGGLGGGSFFTPEAKDGIVGAIKSRTAFRTELSTK